MTLFLEATAIVTFGALIQGAVGFGVALVSVPFLVALEPRFVPGPMIVAGTFLTVLMAVKERRHIDVLGLKWAVVGRLPGIVAALLVLTIVSGELLQPVTGALVVVGVFMTAAGAKLEPTGVNLFLAGLLSGFMGTTSSIGGPPLALIYQKRPGPELRGTLSGYFIVAGVMSLVALIAAGHFGWCDAKLSALLLPGITLGFGLSRLVVSSLDRHRTALRISVLALAGLAGAVNLLCQK